MPDATADHTSARQNLRALSNTAVDTVTERLGDLPRPVLAAIGAGDAAVEQLAALRVALMERISDNAAKAQSADVRTMASDMPAKAQRVAADYVVKMQKATSEYAGKVSEAAADYLTRVQAGAGTAQEAATQYTEQVRRAAAQYADRAQDAAAGMPDRTQRLFAELPQQAQRLLAELREAPGSTAELTERAQHVLTELAETVEGSARDLATQLPARTRSLLSELPHRASELTGDVSAETVRDTLDAYTEVLGSVYGSLAQRGDRRWSKVRGASLRPGAVVDAGSADAGSADAGSTDTGGTDSGSTQTAAEATEQVTDGSASRKTKAATKSSAEGGTQVRGEVAADSNRGNEGRQDRFGSDCFRHRWQGPPYQGFCRHRRHEGRHPDRFTVGPPAVQGRDSSDTGGRTDRHVRRDISNPVELRSPERRRTAHWSSAARDCRKTGGTRPRRHVL